MFGFISVFVLLSLIACRGTESVASVLAVVPNVVAVDDNGVQPGGVVTPTPVIQVSIVELEEHESPGKESDITLNQIAYINSTGDLLTITPDGTEIRALPSGVQASGGSAGGVMAQAVNLDRFFTWPTWAPDGSKIAVSRVRTVNGRSKISLEVIDTSSAQSRIACAISFSSILA